ncbi:MAG: hypothetical protein ABWY25_01400 [Paenisporosarcina sp.]
MNDLESILEFLLLRKKRKIYLEWRIGPVGEAVARPESVYKFPPIDLLPILGDEKESVSMALIMTATQECPLEVKFKDSKGNEVPAENIVWGSSDEAIVKVNANDAEPQKAIAVSVAVGTGQVNVKADARVGTGTNEITGLLVVEILPAEATVVEISAGTPVETPHVEHRPTKTPTPKR